MVVAFAAAIQPANDNNGQQQRSLRPKFLFVQLSEFERKNWRRHLSEWVRKEGRRDFFRWLTGMEKDGFLPPWNVSSQSADVNRIERTKLTHFLHLLLQWYPVLCICLSILYSLVFCGFPDFLLFLGANWNFFQHDGKKRRRIWPTERPDRTFKGSSKGKRNFEFAKWIGKPTNEPN